MKGATMTLKINSMYKIAGGFLIPRSHWSEDAAPNYAIFEILRGGDNRFSKSHTTLTIKECRKILGIGAKEGVKII